MEIGKQGRLLQKMALQKAKRSIRTLVLRFPILVDLALLPVLQPARHLLYRAVPQVAHAIAGRFYVRGDIDSASRELAKAGLSGAVGAKIAEIKHVIGCSDFPCPKIPENIELANAKKHDNALIVVHALHNALPQDQAGYAQRSQALLKAQKDQGVQIHPYTRVGYPYDLSRAKDDGCPEQVTINGVTYHQIEPFSNLRGTGTERQYIHCYANRLAKVAQQHHALIIHAHSNYLNGLAACWAAKWSGRKSVYEVRGLWHVTRASLEPAFRQSPVFAFHQILELEAMKQADAVIALSSPLKQWMIRHGIEESKIHIIGNAIDAKAFHLPERNQALVQQYGLENKIVVGYAGSLVAYEGLDLLIQAVETCRNTGLEMVLLIVGDGTDIKRLKKLARTSSITEYIHFTGRVAPHRIPDFLSLFDICPLPRLDLPVCNLVPPLKPLEIMSAEKPLVLSALPPLQEFGVEKQSLLFFEPGNAKQLAVQLRKLALEASLRKKLGKNARQWVVANATWQQNARRYKQLYETLGLS